MCPGGDRPVTNGFDQRSPALFTLLLGKYPCEIEVVPSHDGIVGKSEMLSEILWDFCVVCLNSPNLQQTVSFFCKKGGTPEPHKIPSWSGC